jgi:hypothetical protein
LSYACCQRLTACCCADVLCFVSPEQKPIAKTKVQNMFYRSSAFGHLEQKLNSEQKVDVAFRLPA